MADSSAVCVCVRASRMRFPARLPPAVVACWELSHFGFS